jgi:hypothetical protein
MFRPADGKGILFDKAFWRKMAAIDEALTIIKGMRGTKKAFPLNKKDIVDILETERGVKSQMGQKVFNLGLEETTKRDHVICIVKDVTFRPPPEPTVFMLDEEQTILGTEVLPGEHAKYRDMDNVMFLCQDFVVFTDKKQKTREYWFMPPVSFPELTVIDGVSEVVSCSPSPPSDIVIKTNYNLEDDPKLATILVGFNCSN